MTDKKKTILRILDEVNCKFIDLDPHTRRLIVEKLSFFVPYARHTPSFRIGRWDGKVAFATAGGATYINLLDRVLDIVYDAGYEIEIEDLRPQYHFEFPEIDEGYLSDRTWPKGHPMAGEPIMLRDHQVAAANTFFKNTQSIQELATGAGKTILAATMSVACEKYGRTLIIVPSKSLVRQTEADYINIGLDVGVFFGDQKNYTNRHIICTWQSLEGLSKASRQGTAEIDIKDFLKDVVCVMVDECFDGDTNILTPDGWKPIRDIQIGDTIINYSEADATYKSDTVKDIYRNMTISSNETMLELTFDTNKTIKVTSNHQFLTQRGWVRADELTQEDDITSNGGYNTQ